MINNNDKLAIADLTEKKLLEVIDFTKSQNVKADIIGGWTDDENENKRLNEKYGLQIYNNSEEFFSNYQTVNNPITVIFISHIDKCETEINKIISFKDIKINAFIIATIPTTNYKATLITNICKKINAEAHFISITKGEIYGLLKEDEVIWTSNELDVTVKNELEERNIKAGKFLDLGAGLCTQAYHLAKLGFDVLAADISNDAIEVAQLKNKDVEIKYIVDDILETKINDEVDYILDRGCFHCIRKADQPKYIKSIRKILKPNGILFLKVFSKDVALNQGPTLFRKIDIVDLFSDGFKIEKINDSFITDNTGHENKALYAVIKRTA